MASAGRTSLGNIANRKKSVVRLIARLSARGEALGFCYEAGGCGYEVYRRMRVQEVRAFTSKGHDLFSNGGCCIPTRYVLQIVT